MKSMGKKHVLYHDVFNILFLSLISWYNMKFLTQVDISYYGTEALASSVQDKELFSFALAIFLQSSLVYMSYSWTYELLRKHHYHGGATLSQTSNVAMKMR